MRRALVTFVALGLCLAPASAQAFDTGPHADMTRDALTAEGFGRAGANVGMVNNWFVDYYTNPDDNPYSGHANALVGFLRFKLNHENWLHQWVEGARRMHFDAERRQVPMPDLSNTAGVDKEWQRLMFLTRKWVQYAGRHNDPYAVMAVLGISLHSVQDFYAHSNWVEGPRREDGRGGPGVASLGYGETPTWFDIPPAVRAQRTRKRAVEQEQEPHEGAQQGLERAAEVPRGVRDRVLRHAAVDPRGANLARQRAPVEARAVAAEHGCAEA